MATLLVSAEALRPQLGRPGLLVVDVRSFGAYARGHLPTAVNAPLMDYHWADTTSEGIAAFTRQMQRVLGFAGVSARKEVVFYENSSGMSAARGVWLLHYLGHERARLLDGGLSRWRTLGYPVSKDPSPTQPSTWPVEPRESVLATADYVREHLLSPHVAFLDARSPLEFRGVHVRAARGGALPGARNVNWRRALTPDGRFKNTQDLAALYRRAGFTPDREVVAYCQGGYRSAHAYVALKLLGYPRVRNYLGSWFEWGNLPDAPMVTGGRSR